MLVQRFFDRALEALFAPSFPLANGLRLPGSDAKLFVLGVEKKIQRVARLLHLETPPALHPFERGRV